MSFEKNQIYTSLGAKTSYKVLAQISCGKNNLKELLNDARKGHDISETDWEVALCEELKQCLTYDDLDECLQALFKLEHLIEDVGEFVGDNFHFEEFYKHLSPCLLRVLWEISHERLEFEGQKERWLEALRVSIEEELCVWQEKISHKS